MKLKNIDCDFNADIKLIFNHHNNLIKALDKIVTMDNFPVRSDTVSETLTGIIQYFEFFNNFEKHFLKYHKFPFYERYIEQHKIILGSFTAFCDDLTCNRNTSKNNFISLIKELYKYLDKFKSELNIMFGI